MTILDFLSAAGARIPNTNFKTPNWAIYRHDAAGVVTDEDEVNQTIVTICTTVPGSDPLRPEFGCNFLPCLDKPLTTAGPLLRSRITAALATWEKRIKIVSIDVAGDLNGVLTITLVWQYAAAVAGPRRTLTFALQ